MAAFLLVNNLRKKNKPRIYRNRTNPIELFDDEILMNRYRLPRAQIVELIDLCRADMDRKTNRSCPLNPDLQVLITLRYLAKGGFQSELADLHGVSQSSVSRSISCTIDTLKTKLDNVNFPRGEQIVRRTKENFYKLVKFPNVIGCIDGTLVPIIRPKDDEFVYVCRKGFHAVNIQAICDADLRFTNVVCKWPGSTHDSYALTNSHIGQYLEDGGGMQGWLLGDSGYPCRPWLLTPLLNPQTPSEESYNKAQIGTRNTIERAFGVLKSRFRCLHKTTGCLPFSPSKCLKLIYIVFQLHNICINLRVPLPQPEDDDDDDDNDNDEHTEQANNYQGPLTDGFLTRRRLIQTAFA